MVLITCQDSNNKSFWCRPEISVIYLQVVYNFFYRCLLNLPNFIVFVFPQNLMIFHKVSTPYIMFILFSKLLLHLFYYVSLFVSSCCIHLLRWTTYFSYFIIYYFWFSILFWLHCSYNFKLFWDAYSLQQEMFVISLFFHLFLKCHKISLSDVVSVFRIFSVANLCIQ